MGFEMLYRGGASKAHGEDERKGGLKDRQPAHASVDSAHRRPRRHRDHDRLRSQNTSASGLVAMAITIAAVALVTFLF